MKLKQIIAALIILTIVASIGIAISENRNGYKYAGPWKKVVENITINTNKKKQ